MGFNAIIPNTIYWFFGLVLIIFNKSIAYYFCQKFFNIYKGVIGKSLKLKTKKIIIIVDRIGLYIFGIFALLIVIEQLF